MRITALSVKASIYGTILYKNGIWGFGILSYSLAYCFSFFSVIATFDVTCIFALKCFNRFTFLVATFSFLFRHYNGRYNQMKIVKGWIAAIKNSFLNNMALPLSNFDIYSLLIVIFIHSCRTIHQQLYTILFCYLNFKCFLYSFASIDQDD